MNRTLGETIAVSIGTAIPFEKILTSELTLKPEGVIYLNLKTLFRNFYGSFELPDLISDKKLLELFLEEIDILLGIIDVSLPVQLEPILYLMTNKSLVKKMPNAKFKNNFTQKQQYYLDLERLTIEKVIEEKSLAKKIRIYDTSLDVENPNSHQNIILTHLPMDLLSYWKIPFLSLLESHTGELKNKSLWTKKLTSNVNYIHLPFNPLTIQLLGDKSKTIGSFETKVINHYVELSIQKKWKPTTTVEKIVFDLDYLKDPLMVKVFKQMVMVKL